MGHSHHAPEDRVREDQLLQAGRLSGAASVVPAAGQPVARDRAHLARGLRVRSFGRAVHPSPFAGGLHARRAATGRRAGRPGQDQPAGVVRRGDRRHVALCRLRVTGQGVPRALQPGIHLSEPAVPAHPAGAAGGARLRRPALGGGRVLRHHATPRAAGRRRACRAGGQGRRRRHGGPFDRVRLLVEDGREHRLRRREAGAGRRRRARPVRARPQARAGRGVRSGGVESRRHRGGMAEGGVRAEPRRAVRVGRPCEGRRLRRRSDQDEVRWLVRVLRPEDGFAERRVDR